MTWLSLARARMCRRLDMVFVVPFWTCVENSAFLEGKVVSIFSNTGMTTVLVGSRTVSLVCRSLVVLPVTYSVFGGHGPSFFNQWRCRRTYESEFAEELCLWISCYWLPFFPCCTHKVSDSVSLDLLFGVVDVWCCEYFDPMVDGSPQWCVQILEIRIFGVVILSTFVLLRSTVTKVLSGFDKALCCWCWEWGMTRAAGIWGYLMDQTLKSVKDVFFCLRLGWFMAGTLWGVGSAHSFLCFTKVHARAWCEAHHTILWRRHTTHVAWPLLLFCGSRRRKMDHLENGSSWCALVRRAAPDTPDVQRRAVPCRGGGVVTPKWKRLLPLRGRHRSKKGGAPTGVRPGAICG